MQSQRSAQSHCSDEGFKYRTVSACGLVIAQALNTRSRCWLFRASMLGQIELLPSSTGLRADVVSCNAALPKPIRDRDAAC